MKESVAMRKDDAEMSTCRKAGRDLRWGVSLLDTSLTVTFPGNDFSPHKDFINEWQILGACILHKTQPTVSHRAGYRDCSRHLRIEMVIHHQG